MTPQNPCSWELVLPHASLRCVAHDEPAFPWRPVPGCALPVAQVCHVCVRAVVPIEGRFSWSHLCRDCAAIDVALGGLHGAAAMTPHRGQSGADRETVFGRLYPDRVSRLEVVEVTVGQDGATSLTTRDTAPDGDGWASPLAAHRDGSAAVMGVALRGAAGSMLGPESPGRELRIPWAEWQEAFPASARECAMSYQTYVVRLYPWVRKVEPRVKDVEWLAGLLST